MSANLIDRIEDRLAENKNGVKTYAAYANACVAGEKFGAEFARRNGIDHQTTEYIVVYLPNTNRYTVVFRMMDFLNKHQVGGYIGWFANKGFFSI